MKRIVLPILFAAVLSAAESGMTPALNSFTTSCYQQLAGSDGNLILSPFNIATALSMALVGARGQSAEEIESVLHVHYDSAYDAAFGSLLAKLVTTGNTGGNQLRTANGLWAQKGFAIHAAFQNTLAKDYQAPLTLLDFISNPEASRTQINRWTEQHTKEKIMNLLPAGSIKSDTRLVLTSAIYFYGKWKDAFVSSRTQPAPFSLSTGATIQTSFMNQTSHFAYTEAPSAQILEINYAGTGIAFEVLLPKALTGLPDLEKIINLGKPRQLVWQPDQSEGTGKPPEVPCRIGILPSQSALDHGHARTFHRPGGLLWYRPEPQDLSGHPQGFRRCIRTGY
jgi:serpin B